mmetsp:Transcript_32132/g.49132  ORF Transcript_32132/g.49132 Transcript_32132/m.49132 type:complete len:218 (+) Transcript_32132:305-958(+)
MIVVVICFGFMVVEIIGGIISNSLAILTDAAHMLSDVAGFLISMFSIWMSQKPHTSSLSFGYHRAEILGALASVLIIWAMVIWLALEATERILYHDDVEIDAPIMLITAFISLACNLFNLIALGHCPCVKVDTSFYDNINSVYKPHGGHSCGHDHGGGDHHDHSHHEHDNHGHHHDHAHHEHQHEHQHEHHEHHSHDHPEQHQHDPLSTVNLKSLHH